MINTLSKINLSKIGWEGGGSTSIWIMSLNIQFVFLRVPLKYQNRKYQTNCISSFDIFLGFVFHPFSYLGTV